MATAQIIPTMPIKHTKRNRAIRPNTIIFFFLDFVISYFFRNQGNPMIQERFYSFGLEMKFA